MAMMGWMPAVLSANLRAKDPTVLPAPLMMSGVEAGMLGIVYGAGRRRLR